MRDRDPSLFTDHESVSMLLRFILYSILAYLVLRFVRRLLAPARARGSRAPTDGARSAQMIRCESCGMFITQTSALLIGGREFCSKGCAKKANRA